jgi:starvation-inducible outer membrane lipoprotein
MFQIYKINQSDYKYPDFQLTQYNTYKDNPMIRWKDGLWKDISRLLTK